jgi:hypothetical protein
MEQDLLKFCAEKLAKEFSLNSRKVQRTLHKAIKEFESKKPAFSSLPTEIKEMIMLRMRPKDACSFAMTNREHYQIQKSKSFWHLFIFFHWDTNIHTCNKIIDKRHLQKLIRVLEWIYVRIFRFHKIFTTIELLPEQYHLQKCLRFLVQMDLRDTIVNVLSDIHWANPELNSPRKSRYGYRPLFSLCLRIILVHKRIINYEILKDFLLACQTLPELEPYITVAKKIKQKEWCSLRYCVHAECNIYKLVNGQVPDCVFNIEELAPIED